MHVPPCCWVGHANVASRLFLPGGRAILFSRTARKHIRDNFDLFGWELSPEDCAVIDTLANANLRYLGLLGKGDFARGAMPQGGTDATFWD